MIPTPRQLPDPLLFADGRAVTTPDAWRVRRAELLEMVQAIQYGNLPPAPDGVSAYRLGSSALKERGGALMTHYRLTMQPNGFCFLTSLMLPPGTGPFPVVVYGDGCWRYLTDEILQLAARRGYAVAFFNRLELAPDAGSDARDTGLYTMYPDGDFGALAAWAWGYHRVVDFVRQLAQIDGDRIAVTGHSRGGKTALLAGATDERIALTAPNNSGCGGAGCYRFPDEHGERLEHILRAFSYWFSPRLRDYIGRIGELPFDQHSVKALVAPRALLSTEALGDLWASPRGTRLTHEAARVVYRFLDAEPRIGIFYREGGHAQLLQDWEVLLDFADVQFYGKPSVRNFDANPWR